MKKQIVYALSAVFALAACSAAVQAQVLFTTQQDFSGGWSVAASGLAFAPGAAGDVDLSTTNGLGNLTNPGGTGTAGAMEVTRSTNAFDTLYTPGELSNTSFINAIAGAKTLSLAYTLPANMPGGTFFELDLILNNNNQFTEIAANQQMGDTAGTYQLVYNIAGKLQPGPYTYFSLGFAFISNNTGTFNISVDDVQLNPTPEPSTLAGLALGIGVLAVSLRKRRS